MNHMQLGINITLHTVFTMFVDARLCGDNKGWKDAQSQQGLLDQGHVNIFSNRMRKN